MLALLVERAKRRIDGFNRDDLTYEDLIEHCDGYDIEVVRLPLRRLHGCFRRENGHPYICINSLTSRADQTIALAHEMWHYLDCAYEADVFMSTGNLWNKSKWEYQAQAVGVIALMPSPGICGLRAEHLMRWYGVRREIAEFRLTLKV